jgi:hypothetical protein
MIPPRIRLQMLAVMDDDKRLVPFLFALNHHPFVGYALTDLLTRGIKGPELVALIDRDFAGDPTRAAATLGDQAELTVRRACYMA